MRRRKSSNVAAQISPNSASSCLLPSFLLPLFSTCLPHLYLYLLMSTPRCCSTASAASAQPLKSSKSHFEKDQG